MKTKHQLGWLMVFEGLIWAGLVVIGILYLKDWKSPSKPYSQLAALLALVSTAVLRWQTFVGKKLQAENERIKEEERAVKEQLEQEQFSAPRALARGYFNNFAAPATTRLLDDKIKDAEDVRFYIFVPEKLSDLNPAPVTNFKSEMERKGFVLNDRPVLLGGKDRRTVLSVRKKDGGKLVFLDFPATMRTLVDVVDYKIPSPANSMDEPAKDKLGRKYIELFHQELEELRIKADDTIKKRIQFVKKDLKFPNAPAGF
ncbi:MAG: STING domain-containing protein [Limisphaerales bacterium]